MKNRYIFLLVLIGLIYSLSMHTAFASGFNFVFPGAHRARISQGYITNLSPPKKVSHLAYDYPFANYTKIAAAKGGNVRLSRWAFEDNDAWWPECYGNINDRGNYIILDHGGGLETWYFHMSNTGNTPGAGTQFALGQYLAKSDHTGCSSGAHLHFATKLNGTPFDPYAAPDWVSGEPVPTGFVDQNHVTRGPYALDRTKIRNKWLALEGRLGSPLGNDYYETTPPPSQNPADILAALRGVLAYTYYQKFERGYIYFTGSGAAYAVEYNKTYLPDVRAHRLASSSGWNSKLYVRNDGPTSADVSITIYNEDGTVKDSRSYKSLRKNAVWTLDVREVVYSALLNDWTQDFSGSAIVSASRDVSVMVTQEYNNASTWAAYSGVRQPATDAYAPVLHKDNNGWNSQIYIQNTGSAPSSVRIEFKPWAGFGNYHGITVPLAAWERRVLTLSNFSNGDLGSTFIGSAYISNNGGEQPLAVAWSQFKGTSSLMEASNAGGVGPVAYSPLVQNYNAGWASGIAMQNASAVLHIMTLRYHRYNDGAECHLESRNVGAYHVYMYPSPPGNGNIVGENCTSVLTGRIHGNGFGAAANVNQLKIGSNSATDYAAIGAPGTKVGIPLVRKGKNGWNSGIVVQNTTGNPTNVTISYYNKNGDFISSRTESLDTIGQALIDFPVPTGTNFEGSAVVTANLAVAVVINHLQDGSGGDRIMTHVGTHY